MSSSKRKNGSDDNEKNSGASQKKKKRTRFNDEPDDTLANADITMSEAEVGIVERVVVTNFMCHKKLEVTLGSNVNYIIGRNGSGKSAILTAIIVGLGGKAAITSRGNSLKGFIKEGSNYSLIAITLRNRGGDAFKPEEYGESILVERRISADGTSIYRLKSKEGKLISQKKDELITILDCFNIQIDNPVSILTQDTSRSFLNTSNEKDKYAFFLKATQLEKITDDYQKIIEEKQCTKEMLKRKKKVLPDLLAEMNVFKEKYDDMQQLKKMKNKIRELRKELAWAIVNGEKEDVEAAETQVRKLESKLPSYEAKVATAHEEESKVESVYNDKCTEVQTYRDEVTDLINEKEGLAVTARKKRDCLKKSQNDFRKVEGEIHRAQKDQKELIDAINEIKNTAQQDVETERLAKENMLAEKQEEMKQLENQCSVSNHYFRQIEENIQQRNNEKFAIQNQIKDANNSVNKARRRLTELEANKKNKLAVFGYHTGEILKAIDDLHSKGKFHRKPVGPLGALIELADKKWAMAVEQTLGGNMMAYACHDGYDMRLLKEIFKRFSRERSFREPPIIMSAFTDQLYDVSSNAPGRQFLSVLNALRISNNIVANSLIDQSAIESVLLIENAKDAQKVMWNDNLRPRASFKALSKEGHQIIGGRISRYYSCDKQPKYFQQDISGSIRDIEAELIQLQEQEKQLRKNLSNVDAQIQNDKRERDRTKKKCLHEQDKINHLQMEMQELQMSEEDKIPDVAAFEVELKEVQSKIAMLNQTRDEYEVTVKEETKNFAADRKLLANCDERCKQACKKLETMEETHLELESNLRHTKGTRKHYEEQLQKIQNKIKAENEKLQNIRENFEKSQCQATEYCEMIETSRERKQIEAEIITAEKRVQREEKSRGNVDEITNNYHNALERYETASRQHNNCKTILKKIERAMMRRIKRFQDFRRLVSGRAKQHFDMLLSQRGYVGKITFDHQEEKLRIEVNVENQKGAEVGDTKALSGGERSFSTICFVMALWDAMEAPFRCLDEFDVFMDMLNRRISMNMLMKIASEQVNRQFILLTPQDMSAVSGSKRVRIFKLTDPERGQQTLGFEPI